MEKYVVEFKLYQYNSGAADNGTRIKSIDCETLQDAILIKNKINKVFNSGSNLSDEDEDFIWVKEFIEDSTISGGFLKSTAEIYLITKTKI